LAISDNLPIPRPKGPLTFYKKRFEIAILLIGIAPNRKGPLIQNCGGTAVLSTATGPLAFPSFHRLSTTSTRYSLCMGRVVYALLTGSLIFLCVYSLSPRRLFYMFFVKGQILSCLKFGFEIFTI
jgi:hypothetical protein